MGIAKSFENDVLFAKKYERLKEFVQLNNRPPTRKENQGLHSFVAKSRLRYRQNPELVFWQWRVPLLEGIRRDIYIWRVNNNSGTIGAQHRAPLEVHFEPNKDDNRRRETCSRSDMVFRGIEFVRQ